MPRDTKKLRSVIYARVSSDPTRETRSVAGQIEECEAVIARNGWQSVHEPFADNNRSASRHRKTERPEFAKLLDYIDSGACDVVVVWNGSRAQRDLRDYLKLRDICADRQVMYCMNGRVYDLQRTDDRFNTGLDALLAERAADEIRDNVRRGMRASAQAGRPPGRLLYGFKRVYDDRGAFIRQEENPEQAVVVRDIFKRADDGEALTSIARDLNSRGIPTPAGAEWDGTAVKRVLTNPAYAGLRVFQRQIIGPGVWDGLVDEDLWYRVNAVISDPNRRTQRGTALKWQMTSAARCGVCPPDKDGRPVPIKSLVTRRNHPGYGCLTCNRVTIRADWLDEFIDTLMIERLRQKESAALFAPADDSTAVRRAKLDVRKLEARLAEHVEEAARGNLSAAALGAVERSLMPQIAEAKERARRLALPKTLRDLNPLQLADNWRDTPVRVRRDVIRLAADIVIDPRLTHTNSFEPGRLARSRWRGDPLTWGEHWRNASP